MQILPEPWWPITNLQNGTQQDWESLDNQDREQTEFLIQMMAHSVRRTSNLDTATSSWDCYETENPFYVRCTFGPNDWDKFVLTSYYVPVYKNAEMTSADVVQDVASLVSYARSTFETTSLLALEADTFIVDLVL